LLNDGFSLEPKHVARNKIDINSVVAGYLYYPFTVSSHFLTSFGRSIF